MEGEEVKLRSGYEVIRLPMKGRFLSGEAYIQMRRYLNRV